jgi:Ca2+-binding EF-hand superfamily protein
MKRITLILMVCALVIPALAQVQPSSQGQQRQAGQNGPRGQRGRKVFKQMDKNNDRQISREEWSGKPETFARLDRNNDGILTLEELKAARKQPRDGQTPTQP